MSEPKENRVDLHWLEERIISVDTGSWKEILPHEKTLVLECRKKPKIIQLITGGFILAFAVVMGVFGAGNRGTTT